MIMLKKKIENIIFFQWLTCVFYQIDLKHLRVLYFFVNVCVLITLKYITNLNQNLDQILSSWLNENFIFNSFVLIFCLQILTFSILIFLFRNSSLDEDFRVIFIWIFLFSIFIFLPVLFIFGSISVNLSQKKDVLFQFYHQISIVERKMSCEEAYTIFKQIVKDFPRLRYLSLSDPNYEFKVKVYYEVLTEANFTEYFNNCYAAAPSKRRFVHVVLESLKLYWEQIQTPVL